MRQTFDLRTSKAKMSPCHDTGIKPDLVSHYFSWDGHSSIMSEIRDQLRDDFGEKRKPSALISCVGGGGLAVGKYLIHYHWKFENLFQNLRKIKSRKSEFAGITQYLKKKYRESST